MFFTSNNITFQDHNHLIYSSTTEQQATPSLSQKFDVYIDLPEPIVYIINIDKDVRKKI